MAVLMLLPLACGKVPQEKVNIAKHCIDSLKNAGAGNSSKFIELQDTLKSVYAQIEVQNSKLFKKFNQINSSLDEVITVSRRFVITDDILATKQIANTLSTVNLNGNTYRFQVEIDMDAQRNLTSDDVLEMANKIDQAVRNNVLNAKLIRVKIQ